MTALEYLDPPADGYRAGACNIGPAEIARRRRTGIVGLATAGVLAIGLLAVGAPPLARLLVGVPLFFGLMGLVQAQLRFCVGFALAGLRNLGSLGAQSKVEDAGARAADRRRALGVGLAVAAAAGVGAVLFALLPL